MRSLLPISGLAIAMLAASHPAPAAAQDFLGPFLDAQRSDNLRRHQQRVTTKPGNPPRAGADAPAALFRVGRTGINCVRAPCPHRGVVPALPDGTVTGSIWSSERLPDVLGDAEDYRRISAAWNDSGCLIIEGDFDGGILTVDRIVGNC